MRSIQTKVTLLITAVCGGVIASGEAMQKKALEAAEAVVKEPEQTVNVLEPHEVVPAISDSELRAAEKARLDGVYAQAIEAAKQEAGRAEAIGRLEWLAEAGYYPAMWALARWAIMGINGVADREAGERWLERIREEAMAQVSAAEAMQVGLWYMRGERLPKDAKVAYEWIMHAQGLLSKGGAVQWDLGLAELAREAGDTEGARRGYLAVMRAGGTEAMKARRALADILYEDEGRAGTRRAAWALYEAVLDDGAYLDEVVLYRMGQMAMRGIGTIEDTGMGVKLLNEAAKRGHPQAQFALGVIYSTGTVVMRNYGRAYKWLSIAAAAGEANAAELRDRVGKQMARAEREDAQAEAIGWWRANKPAVDWAKF